MQFFQVLSVVSFGLLASVQAAPAAAVEESALDERTLGNVYLCTGSNWSNTCQNVEFKTDQTCTPIPEPFAYSLGSIGPDAGQYCRLYPSAGCVESKQLLFVYPGGYSDLYNQDGVDYGHQAAYIACQACSAC
ncbi:Uu.00g013500.m01.CDS01 [Anthostomella pinea]|uniref:Uu.00g013500.m01.CDS01 n=1 Tax=Anthostomella pinea TaxID=933095 RepID=A0AAI8VY56_9PEZI|nr:Uu.00g013500.m01.CDS01 [Anthostomella pinea]